MIKTGEPGEKPSEQGENQWQTQSTYGAGPESNTLSSLRHPCSPKIIWQLFWMDGHFIFSDREKMTMYIIIQFECCHRQRKTWNNLRFDRFNSGFEYFAICFRVAIILINHLAMYYLHVLMKLHWEKRPF